MKTPRTPYPDNSAAEKAEQTRHDHAIAGYSPGLVLDVAKDLSGKRYWNRNDPEHRWGMARLAALMRRMYSPQTTTPA